MKDCEPLNSKKAPLKQNEILNSKSSLDYWFLHTWVRRLLVASIFGILGLSFVILQYRGQLRIDHDTASYAVRLIFIAKGKILEPSNIWPLGWPILALPLFKLGFSPLYCFIFLASLSYILLLWCTLEILYPYCSPITTLIACSVIALEPYFSSLIWPGLTDVPFTAIIAALTVVCIRADVSTRNSIIIGILAAISCNLRYPGMFLFLGVPVLQLVRSTSLKNRIVQASIALGSLSIFASPVFIRNLLAGEDIFWKHIVKTETGTLLESFVLWILHNLRAALLIPTSWILKIQTDSQWWYIIGALGILFFLIIMTFTLIFRKNKILLITFLLAVMYTGAMLLTRVHIETRYLMPSIFLFLIWFFVAIEITGKKYPKIQKFLLSLALVHAVAVSIYMSIVAYNFKGTPDFRESIKELRAHQLSGDKIAIVDDKGWPLFAVITDIEPIQVDSKDRVASLKKIRSVGESLVLATAIRSKKGSDESFLTPWSGILEDWVKQYPQEFRVRYRGKWLMIVEHIGK